jgi:hypothetical protein
MNGVLTRKVSCTLLSTKLTLRRRGVFFFFWTRKREEESGRETRKGVATRLTLSPVSPDKKTLVSLFPPAFSRRSPHRIVLHQFLFLYEETGGRSRRGKEER